MISHSVLTETEFDKELAALLEKYHTNEAGLIIHLKNDIDPIHSLLENIKQNTIESCAAFVEERCLTKGLVTKKKKPTPSAMATALRVHNF